jgi:hypothetical protein
LSHNGPIGPSNPVPVHIWPLDVRGHRFELGLLLDCSVEDIRAAAKQRLAQGPGAGKWSYDFCTGALRWSDEVYDIFGVPRGTPITRAEALTYYSPRSRPLMERIRSEAIKQKKAFVIDAEMRPGHGTAGHWMRLIGAPVVEYGDVVALEGFKQRI